MGIHVVVWCDSLTNLNRTFDRPQVREFAQRVLFQMSATDSSTLMDTPAAAKLGRTRALFLTEEPSAPRSSDPTGCRRRSGSTRHSTSFGRGSG